MFLTWCSQGRRSDWLTSRIERPPPVPSARLGKGWSSWDKRGCLPGSSDSAGEPCRKGVLRMRGGSLWLWCKPFPEHLSVSHEERWYSFIKAWREVPLHAVNSATRRQSWSTILPLLQCLGGSPLLSTQQLSEAICQGQNGDHKVRYPSETCSDPNSTQVLFFWYHKQSCTTILL